MRPSAVPSGNSAANMSVPNFSSGACRPASSSRSRVRSRACEKIRLAWSITRRLASPGLSALAAVSSRFRPSADSKASARFFSASGEMPMALAAFARSRAGTRAMISSRLGDFAIPES